MVDKMIDVMNCRMGLLNQAEQVKLVKQAKVAKLAKVVTLQK